MAEAQHTQIKTKDYLSLVDQFLRNAQVTVLHMLRFNEIANYPPSSSHAFLEPMSGRDAFWQRYVPAGVAAAHEAAITPAKTRFFSAAVTKLLVHNDTLCDVTARTYANFAKYARYQANRAYMEKAVPHRAMR